ncbi:GNAT family N-acetyltransferase [Pontibacillus salicampi]|uniref:GNAT family N-acetyltransferase n=1 Tax=Pontibacillus salicampi TaxID=1449801 RepID=A0ABV6LM77_9BACI
MIISYKPLVMSEDTLDTIVPIYLQAHDKEDQEVRSRFKKHASYPGYIGMVAVCEREVVGFAYGYTSLAGQFYNERLKMLMKEEEVSTWMENCFEFVELAVHPSFQGHGIGSTLEKRLLDESRHHTSILTTGAVNQKARKLYSQLGWEEVREGYIIPNGEEMVIMAKHINLPIQ